MSDQAWALFGGIVTMLLIRILDWWMPKGRMSRWAQKHSVPIGDDEEDQETSKKKEIESQE